MQLSLPASGQGRYGYPGHRLVAGLVFSPDYSYRSLFTNPSDQWIVDLRDSNEYPKFGYTTGLSLMLRLKPVLAIETGVLFSDKGWITDLENLYKQFPWSPLMRSLGPVVNTHYYFMQVPVKINYYIINRNWKWFITAGITTEIMTNDDLEKFGFSALAGTGVEYALNSRITFRCEPVFRYKLPPLTENTIDTYFYTFGLNCGVMFDLL